MADRSIRMSVAALLAVVLLAAPAARAQTAAPSTATSNPMRGHTMSTPSDTKRPPPTASTTAYREAANKMHMAMAIPYTGDADKDFAAAMIAHHQGAIDMAKVELQHGTDAELRKLAQDVVDAQEKEIAFMRAWQAKHQ